MLQPIKIEFISPQEFKKTIELNSGNIKSTRFIAPVIGSGLFGQFEITYENPILKNIQSHKDYASYVQ